MKRISENEEAETGITILVLILVVLFCWQFIVPLFGYSSLTDLIGATEEPPEAITFNQALKFNDEFVTIDSVTGDFSSIDRVPDYYPAYDIDSELEIPDYTFVIQTNAPAKITNPYAIKVYSIIYEQDGFSETETNLLNAEILSFSGTGTKTFNVPLDNDYISQEWTEYTDIISVLYDPNGIALETLHLVIV